MSWIKSHKDLEYHPKLLKLEALCTMDRNGTVGVLHRFWYWTMAYAEDGDLSKWGLETLSKAIGIDANNLVQAGWIDQEPYLRVHDWFDYIGDYLRAKYRRNPEKYEAIKNKCTGTAPVQNRASTRIDKIREDKIREDKDLTDTSTKTFKVVDLMALWNEKAHLNLPRVTMLNKTREAHAKARLSSFPDKSFWENTITKINESSFLTGLSSTWKADFDWILNPTNLTKILEGNYDNKRKFN